MKFTSILAFLAPIALLSVLTHAMEDEPVEPVEPIVQARPPNPPNRPYTLITYENDGWKGSSQVLNGWGCVAMSGATVRSFRGRNDYHFHSQPGCKGMPIYEGDDNEERIRPISPKSVYIDMD